MIKKSLLTSFLLSLIVINLILWPYLIQQIRQMNTTKKSINGEIKTELTLNEEKKTIDKEINSEKPDSINSNDDSSNTIEQNSEENPEDSWYPEDDDELIKKIELENAQLERKKWRKNLNNKDIVTFDDKAIEGHIRKEIGLYNDAITAGDLKTIKSLSDLPSCNLTGLEFAINLESISFSRKVCNEDSINFNALKYLPKIKNISLYDNNIKSSYHFANLDTLESLALDSTNIEELNNLNNLSNLQFLSLANTLSLTSLTGIETLKNLKVLYIGSESVTDLSPVANLLNLEELEFNRTNITDISPVVNLHKLTNISMNHTEVEDLAPLSTLDNLRYVNIDNTHIDDITPLLNLPSLEEVSMFNNDFLNPNSDSVKQLKKKVWKTAGP